MTIMTTRSVRVPGAEPSGAPEAAVREQGRRVVSLDEARRRVALRGRIHGRAAGGPEPLARVARRPAGGQVATPARPVVLDSPRMRRCDSPAAPSVHGSRLTRRGRLVVTLVWVVLVALAVLPFVRAGGAAESDGRTVPVRIEAGDTLWQVAQNVAPGADPRVLVDRIVEVNGLRTGGDIRPGDTVLVPVAAG